jgi:Holliday junction resolvase RusA-like endonuclease
VTFVIHGPPRTKKNHQRIGQVRGRPAIFQARSSENWEKQAVSTLLDQRISRGWEMANWPVSMRALVYRDRAVGDLLNYLAAISDALEGAGIVSDDKWIVSVDGSRLFKDAKNPRVEVTVLTVLDQSGQ